MACKNEKKIKKKLKNVYDKMSAVYEAMLELEREVNKCFGDTPHPGDGE